MLPIPKKLLEQGVRDMVRISDARMSGTAYGTCVLHVAPESFVGRPTGARPDRRPDLAGRPEPPPRPATSRKKSWPPAVPSWVPREFPATRGYEKLFAHHVTQAPEGCDFDFLHGAGGVPEPAIH